MINQQNLNGWQDPGHDSTSTIPVDKFGEVIGYDKMGHIGSAQGATTQYNGNITWLMYQMSGVGYNSPKGTVYLVGNSYTYDGTNRLKTADFGYWHDSSWYPTGAYDGNYTYDNAGNFITLKRYGSTGSIQDSLNYTYGTGSNRLFNIRGSASANYTYDANGNVKYDSHRGIGYIIYDPSNMPVQAYLTNGQQLVYDNDVNGSRVRNTIQGSNGSDNFYFNGADGKTEAVSLVAHGSNLIYNILGAGGDNLGQVKVVSASPTRYYYLKDHLGSIKVTVNTAGAVVGYDDYYPYGLVMTGRSLTASEDGRYKFTGKERDASDGLDYFGARYYDSWNGRWGQVDPKASKYPAWSSYNYVENNPLVNNDFDGMEIDVRSVEPKTLSYIINDWNSISAAKFKVSDGMLVQDIPSATFTLNGETITMNGVQIQDDRNEALTFINNAINDPTRITVFNSDKLSSQTEPNEVQINLNSSQINKFITNTTGGLDNRTMGYGMTLLHELGHSMIGDKYLNNGHGQLEDDDRPGKTGQ